VRSGADPGRPLDWPHPGGASSSAAAHAALWSLVGRPSGRACLCPWGEAQGTSACDVTTTASSCCGPATVAVTRDGLPVTAALAAARGALSERRLVITGTPDLSALASVRAGTVSITLTTGNQRSKRPPLKIKSARGKMQLTSNWRIPASSSFRAGGCLRRAHRRLLDACWRLQQWPGGGRFRARRVRQLHSRLLDPW
jgi:hypothetical protein